MNEQQKQALKKLGVTIRTIEVDGVEIEVPRGLARNKSRRAWQLRFSRDGEQHGPFNFTDGEYGGAAESASAATDRLIQERPTKKGGSTAGVSGKVQPVRLSPRLTLNWRLNHGLPVMTAQIYSPITKRSKPVFLGNREEVLDPGSYEIGRLAEALVMNERVNREDQDPFRTVSSKDIDACREMAAKILTSKPVVEFFERGAELETA